MAQKVMISIHVPKTGGTSFRRMLEELFGSSLQADYASDPRPELMDGPDLRGTDDEIRKLFAGIQCVHGHFNARKYMRLLEVDGIEPIFVTWLRDPVERCMSTYHFLRRLDTPPDQQPDWEQKAKSLSEREFFEQTRYGANRQFAQLRALDYDQFSFIGITERYEDSAAMFRHLFFPRVRNIEIKHELRNESRTGGYRIPAPLRAHLQSLNVHDQQLYHYGRGWLSGAVHNMPAPHGSPSAFTSTLPESGPSYARLWQSFRRRISH